MENKQLSRKKSHRTNSNVFHMIDQNQIIELRDAFGLFDSLNEGILSFKGLSKFLDSIGSPFTNTEIKEMLELLGPSYNFMMLLTVIGDKLSNTSNKSEILSSFKVFDDKNDGTISFKKFNEIIDKNNHSKKEIEYLLQDCVSQNGLFIDYNKLTHKMKHGEFLNEIN